jgi:manganese-dependent inorganic pyrophosphatase
MEKILVFGHKSPDTDSIASSIAMAYLQTKLGKAAEPRRLGSINKETEYALNHFKIGAPELLDSVNENDTVILVDHNEAAQSVENREKAHIYMVVDHHTMDFKASEPLYYYAEPVGCTCTVLYKLFEQNNVVIPTDVAGLMLSAIISDTLLFKSPTCTNSDKEVAEKLAKISNTDINTYGLAMLKAGTDLSSFSEKELLNLDGKLFTLGDVVKTKVAQVNTADIDDVMTRKSKLEDALKQEVTDLNLDLNVFLITDIINSNSQVIAFGTRTDLVEKSFSVTLENNTAFLPGVVSRKKQVIPVLTANV